MSKEGWKLVLALALIAGSLAGPGAIASEEPSPAPAPSPSPTPQETASPSPLRTVFGTIMGNVLDPRKKPLGGWMVQLKSRGDDGLLRVTGTDEKGHYVFKDLPAGTYDVTISSEEGASRNKGRIDVRPPFRNIVDFEVGAASDKTTGALPASLAIRTDAKGGDASAGDPSADGREPIKGVPVRGTFLDTQKRPVAEVSVTIVALQGKGIFQAFSRDDGSFEIPEVAPGRYRILVVSPGYVTIDLKSVEVPPASGLNVSLSLVDYPLNTRERPQERLPREEPLPAPAAAPVPAPPSTSQPS